MTHNKWSSDDEKRAIAEIEKQDKERVHVLHRMRYRDQLLIEVEKEMKEAEQSQQKPQMDHRRNASNDINHF
jgi:hypothetical protein